MELDKFYKLFITQGFRFSTDSRSIQRGDIFFALKGENFNGNKYALQALSDGASYAVVDENVGNDLRLIKVDNVLRYFQNLANMHRRAFSIPIIAIAGSNGKTTTKNLVEAVLKKSYRTHVTAGNFNNHIGVPITLLTMPQDTEIAVIEIGTNSPGEIRELCWICEPNFGIITNIGKEHLEGFGSLEAVAKEESELYHFLLKNEGHVFVNSDDEWLSRMSRAIENRAEYSKSSAIIENLVPSISFKYKDTAFVANLMGDYNLDNIIAAICIAEYFGVDLSIIAEAIREYSPDNNRSQIIKKGSNSIWLDAYNANPSSVSKAIENFKHLENKAKVLILGDMFELGKHADEEHLAIIDLFISLDFKEVFLLGDAFKRVSEQRSIKTFASMEELCSALEKRNFQNTSFLIKGSRGMKMERALEAIR